MNTSEVLNAAADHIERRGWTGASGTDSEVTKRAWYPDPEAVYPVCAEGALRLANGGLRANDAIKALKVYLHDRYPECVNSVSGEVVVFSWNDAPGRTADEVIAALRAAAVIEAAKETADRPAITIDAITIDATILDATTARAILEAARAGGDLALVGEQDGAA